MALIGSSEFKGVIVQIICICVVEVQFECAWALTKITLRTICHAEWALNLMHLSKVVLSW